MKLRLALTDYQLAVVERKLVAGDGATSVGDLLVRAIEFDVARPPEPRWRTPRPPARRLSRRASSAQLDAVLPAATASALALCAGATVRIEQLGAGQGVDLSAYELGGSGRRFSAARTRALHGIHPTAGVTLWSSPPEIPLLSIETDTAPDHDLCFPPCTAFEYEQLTGIPGHLGCHELERGARRRWRSRHDTAGSSDDASSSDILNLWLPTEVDEHGQLHWWPIAARRGDYIELRACTDLLVVLSNCPDDLFGSSQYQPGPVRLVVRDPRSRSLRVALAKRAPHAALARNRVAVEIPDGLNDHLDQVMAGGWLGDTAPRVARALLFRWLEATTA